MIEKKSIHILKDNEDILEKKKNKKFKHIGFMQMLSVWKKETRDIWKKNFIINTLLEERDFATIFEVMNTNFQFSERQYKKIIKNLNKVLIDNQYKEKFYLLSMIDKYQIEISNETYYYFCISNIFNKKIKNQENNDNDILKEEDKVCNKILQLMKNKEFKEGLKEFIVKDIENKPDDFAQIMAWSVKREVYYNPWRNKHLFGDMSKSQYKRILKVGIGNNEVMSQYQALANKAKSEVHILETLGINTKNIIEKAQKTLLLKEESLTPEMKEIINNISEEIEKIKKQGNEIYIEQYKDQLYNIVDYTLPNVIKKYLSIDEEYRETLKNIEGKSPSQLLIESLNNINIQVNAINQSINEEKILSLSVDNRKIKSHVI